MSESTKFFETRVRRNGAAELQKSPVNPRHICDSRSRVVRKAEKQATSAPWLRTQKGCFRLNCLPERAPKSEIVSELSQGFAQFGQCRDRRDRRSACDIVEALKFAPGGAYRCAAIVARRLASHFG